MHTLLHDLRYAARVLVRQPLFSLVCLLTLALGIGANAAIFSLIDAVLLRPLSFADAGELVSVWAREPFAPADAQDPVSLPKYEFIRDQQNVFSELGVIGYDGFAFTGRGDPAQITGSCVSARFLQTLGVQPLQGRLFLPEEDVPGGPRVVVLSETFWRKYCAADPALIGQSLTFNGVPHTMVGIVKTQPTFPLNNCDVFVPGVTNVSYLLPAVVQQGGGYLVLTARLKPGVTRAQANEAMQLLAGRYRQTFPAHVDARPELRVTSLQEDVVGPSRSLFYTLAGAVGCVLLIACVNVANLQFARLARRRREVAIRTALGAGRLRLARQFLTESVLLTLLAGVLGIALALWCVGFARGLGPEVIPRAEEIHLDGATLLFTLGISLVAGVLLGVVPALYATRGNPGEALQHANSRGSTGGLRQGRTRSALLIAQVALSLVLLTGTGLLLTSLWQLQRVRLGYNPNGLLIANLNLPAARYAKPEQQAEFFARLNERLNALPGVRRAATANGAPLLGGAEMFYAVVGQPVPPVQQRQHAKYCVASPGYFATLETPVLRGRDFTERDRAEAPPVMLLNETMAKKLFPDQEAVGQKLLCSVYSPTVTEIVGVVADARTTDVSKPAVPEMYFSMFQRGQTFMNLIIRADTPDHALGLLPSVRAAVRSLDSSQPIDREQEMKTLVSQATADRHLLAMLLAIFAGLALLLAAIGIYGVTAYSVAQRTREIGVRMALGAQRADVFRLIVGGGMKLILAGIVVGVVSAFGLTRLLASLLYGVGASDPFTFVAVVVILVVVALLANYLPARRATRIDPLDALREE